MVVKSGIGILVKAFLPKDYPCIRSKRSTASLNNARFFNNRNKRRKNV